MGGGNPYGNHQGRGKGNFCKKDVGESEGKEEATYLMGKPRIYIMRGRRAPTQCIYLSCNLNGDSRRKEGVGKTGKAMERGPTMSEKT